MKLRIPARLIQHSQVSQTMVAALCRVLDEAIAPMATISLVLGLVAVFLQISRTANYLMATGLLLHLTVWFANWLEGIRQR